LTIDPISLFLTLSLSSKKGDTASENFAKRLARLLPDKLKAKADLDVEAWLKERAFDPKNFVLE